MSDSSSLVVNFNNGSDVKTLKGKLLLNMFVLFMPLPYVLGLEHIDLLFFGCPNVCIVRNTNSISDRVI